MRFQQKNKSLNEIAKEKSKDYFIELYNGADEIYSLICRHGRIVIPKQIQKSLVG